MWTQSDGRVSSSWTPRGTEDSARLSQSILQLGDDHRDLKFWLLGALEDLDSRELKLFHWLLQTANESRDGFQPIRKSRLEHADRLDTVDLMVQAYAAGAGEVARSLLQQVERRTGRAPDGELQQEVPTPAAADEKHVRILSDFVRKVTEEKLRQLLEALVSEGVLDDSDRKCVLEQNHTRANQASSVADMVRDRGACETMVSHLQSMSPAWTSGRDPPPHPSAEAVTEIQRLVRLGLKKKVQCVFEGIANPPDQIYTELYITEGGATAINQEHENGEL
ncbi:unnamed protein product [Menidia menidia]|uniref:(Atlantic silverside) hypothetical protein n=1 Tax=Menidia menidia TaxID=238744 RepID=A0A8S4BMS1_9TELE|nr:unnamed protein product [Menidia menidia]